MLPLILLAVAIAPEFRKTYAADATRLREDLLDSYDKLVPPEAERPDNSYSRAGTDVEMQIRFFKVDSVRAAEGLMRMKIWLRFQWVDERLAWEPEAYGNITEVQMNAASISAPEDTEIWLPDIQPYNTIDGISNTLDASLAVVYSNGVVFWSRPGMLDIMCKFSGLVAFPFDKLTCEMEFGGWAMSAGFQGIRPFSSGAFAFSNQEATSGSSYTEYQIQTVEATLHSNDYSTSVDWPVMRYRIQMGRASMYYVTLILVPGVLMALLSMGVFFMSFQVGERLSYGITLILATEVSKVVTSSFVPVCGEVHYRAPIGAHAAIHPGPHQTRIPPGPHHMLSPAMAPPSHPSPIISQLSSPCLVPPPSPLALVDRPLHRRLLGLLHAFPL